MSRYLFISTAESFQTPYIETYESFFEGSYDFLFWNRSEAGCNRDRANPIPFFAKNNNKFEKLIGYLKFRHFAKKHLIENEYDGVVLLQTQPALMLGSVLIQRFAGRFICDIRDYFFENFSIVTMLESKLFRFSYANLISSPGYKMFLPKEADYCLLHNNHPDLFDEASPSCVVNRPIRIMFIGTIRFFDQCRKLIMRFSKDRRFCLAFYGAGAFALKDACADLNLDNVEFKDVFSPDDTVELLRSADLIFNLYGNNTPLLDYALSNKLYYAAELGKPILVCPDTYMEDVAMRYNLGFVVDLERKDASSSLYDAYSRFDFSLFDKQRIIFLESVNKDNAITSSLLRKFFQNGSDS